MRRPPGPGAIPIRRLELPRQIQWRELRWERFWFYALGVTPKHLTVVRGIWDGDYQSLSWECSPEVIRHGLVFEPISGPAHAVAVCTAGAPLPVRRFPAADLFFSRECLAGTPRWLPPQAFPFAFGEDRAWSIHMAAGGAVLSCYDPVQGLLLKTLKGGSSIVWSRQSPVSKRDYGRTLV